MIERIKENLRYNWWIGLLAVIFMFIGLFLNGCTAVHLAKMNKDYSEMSAVVKDFAKISAQEWLFGSGIIQGSLSEELLPAWVFYDLRKIDEWVKDGSDTLTDFQLGYIVGVRIKMAGPILQAAIKQYAPALLGIQEVVMVLSFIGL